MISEFSMASASLRGWLRRLRYPSLSEIRSLVERIIYKRARDGQNKPVMWLRFSLVFYFLFLGCYFLQFYIQIFLDINVEII